jgi:hypothetical protein
MKRSFLFILVIVCFIIGTSAQIIHIPSEHSTIQAGIDAASDGDTVLVAEGTYFENINFKGKAITVASRFILDGDTFHISKTIIDGSQSTNPDTASTVMMFSGEDTTSVLMGFTITGGSGTITKEWYLGMTCMAGGGIFLFNSGGKIINNIIEENHMLDPENKIGAALGCGIMVRTNHNHTAIIRNNTIRNNTSITGGHWGGGIGLFGGRMLVENNFILNNTLNGLGNYTAGAGIWYQRESEVEGVIDEVIIRNNLIVGNKAFSIGNSGFGSGICEYGLDKYQQMQIYNNVIAENFAEGYCAGFYICLGRAQVYNNTIFNNEATIEGNTIGIDFGGNLLMYNNIVWSNAENSLSEYYYWSTEVNITAYNNVLKEPFDAGYPVTEIHNLYQEPLFVPGTYDLAENSPGIGRGVDSIQVDTTWYYAPAIDFYGNTRPDPVDKYMDIGAVESAFSRPMDNNADLIYIGYGYLKLIPAFHKDTLHYEMPVAASVTVPPQLNAIPADYLAEVEINHATDMLENSTTTITVTAMDGITQKVYTVFFRYQRNDASLCSLSTNFGELIPEFDSETKEYDVIVNDTCPGIGIPEVTYKTCSSGATAKITANALNICDGKHNKTVISVTAENGTTTGGTYKITFSLSDGIDNTNSYNLKVYPNPVEDILKIEHSLPMTEVTVSNIIGQKVLEYKLNSGITCELALAGLRKGMYFIRVKDVSGQVYSRKVIKD